MFVCVSSSVYAYMYTHILTQTHPLSHTHTHTHTHRHTYTHRHFFSSSLYTNTYPNTQRLYAKRMTVDKIL